MANSVDPNHMLCCMASDLGLHCLFRPESLYLCYYGSQYILQYVGNKGPNYLVKMCAGSCEPLLSAYETEELLRRSIW